MQTDITMVAFEALIESAYKLKEEKEDFEALAENVGEKLSAIQAQLLEYMEHFEKTSYKSKWGTIIAATQLSVKTPKDPDQKAKFFEYLAEKGIKDDLLSVNSKTLNSFYNAEFEAARSAGADEFSMPGIEPPTVYKKIQMRK